MQRLPFSIPTKWLSAASEAKAYLRSDRRKPLSLQIREGARLWREYGHFPYQYFKHRLYRQECRQDITSYVPPLLLRRYRDRLNPEPAREMTLNKLLYTQRMQGAGLPVVPILATIGTEGWIRDTDEKQLSYDELIRRLAERGLQEIFLKPTHGCEGRGARKLAVQSGALRYENEALTERSFFRLLFSGSEYRVFLLQPAVQQHRLLAQMNPSSVNTVRIDALRLDDGSIRSSGAFFRLGNGRDCVDNVSAGGYHIRVDLQTGQLDPYAFGHLKYGIRQYEVHPVSGYRFAGVRLPFWTDLPPLLQAGMNALTPLCYLGWDVAFTEKGLILMEASAEHDLFVFQSAIGGLADLAIGKAAMVRRKARSCHPDHPRPLKNASYAG